MRFDATWGFKRILNLAFCILSTLFTTVASGIGCDGAFQLLSDEADFSTSITAKAYSTVLNELKRRETQNLRLDPDFLKQVAAGKKKLTLGEKVEGLAFVDGKPLLLKGTLVGVSYPEGEAPVISVDIDGSQKHLSIGPTENLLFYKSYKPHLASNIDGPDETVAIPLVSAWVRDVHDRLNREEDEHRRIARATIRVVVSVAAATIASMLFIRRAVDAPAVRDHQDNPSTVIPATPIEKENSRPIQEAPRPR